MIHDHLCPHVQVENQRDDVDCQCNLIAKVRKETLAAAVQRVTRAYASPEWPKTFMYASAVIDLIKGDQPIEDKITFIRGNDRLEQLRKNNS